MEALSTFAPFLVDMMHPSGRPVGNEAVYKTVSVNE